MELVDKIVKYLGTDKVLHFAFCGWFVSAFSPLGFLWMFLATVVIIGLSFVKEKWLDTTFDWGDITAGAVGCALSFAVYGLPQLL